MLQVLVHLRDLNGLAKLYAKQRTLSKMAASGTSSHHTGAALAEINRTPQ